VASTIQALDEQDDGRAGLRRTFRDNHPRLDHAEPLRHPGPVETDSGGSG
jgi:endoglucanase